MPSASSPMFLSTASVERSHAADDRDLASKAVLVELPEEAEAVRARETEEDAVNVGLELGDIGP